MPLINMKYMYFYRKMKAKLLIKENLKPYKLFNEFFFNYCQNYSFLYNYFTFLLTFKKILLLVYNFVIVLFYLF